MLLVGVNSLNSRFVSSIEWYPNLEKKHFILGIAQGSSMKQVSPFNSSEPTGNVIA